MNRFRAELRKIWTVRSTYFLTLAMILLGAGLFSFFALGFKNVEHAERSSRALLSALQQPIGLSALLLGILAVVSVGHEYRYNTILYSLTSARERTSVLISKLAALICSALFIAAIVAALSFISFYAGQQLAGIATVAQTMPDINFIWRMLATVIVFVIFGFAIAVIVRSLIAATAIMLILPSTIEPLLSMLLKENVKYLPFTALGNLSDAMGKGPVTTSGLTVLAYVVGLLLIAGVLFHRRDAN